MKHTFPLLPLKTERAVLVTGAAGFVGFHLSQQLLEEGFHVVGFDNVNDYYDPAIKWARLEILKSHKSFTFVQKDLQDYDALIQVFKKFTPDYVVNLAAQAGVRYSLKNPMAYMQSNMIGFLNILEACRHHPVKHLVYASSSSVYGSNTRQPFAVQDSAEHPLSLYAASKKSNEMMAHCYSHLYAIPTTGLRFFTVYGPWGRPDMALFLFTKAILEQQPIQIFNHGHMKRDFTYIDDIIQGTRNIMPCHAESDVSFDTEYPNPATSHAPYRLFNIGNHQPVELMEMITLLEKRLGKEAIKDYLPMQPGDAPATYADITDLQQITGFEPHTSLIEGIDKFVTWYQDYYR